MSALFDMGPAATECPSCGSMTHRTQARLANGRLVWCWPGGDDGRTCRACWDKLAGGRERALRERAQGAAQVPPLYRQVSWADARHRVRQHVGELDASFVARTTEGRDTDARVMGVSTADRASLREIASWKPEHGSMFIEGAPGTGKSLVAAALLNDLVCRPLSYLCVCRDCERRWRAGLEDTSLPWGGWEQERHDRGSGRAATLRVSQPVSARYQDETGIIAALRKPKEEGQGTLRADVLDLCKSVSVLLLNDLGSKEALADWHKDVLFELVDHRYTHGKPTIYTSNMALSTLELRYGPRFASRVRETVGPRRYELTTKWR